MTRTWPSCTLLALLASTAITAQDHPPFSAFMMEADRETALAQSAAPAPVSTDAGLFLLQGDGYHRVRTSKNGFNCLVLRSWTQPVSDAERYYDPRLLAPICYSPGATSTVMQREIEIARLVLAGRSIAETQRAVDAAYAAGTLHIPDRVAFAYMFSSAQWLGENVAHWHPHVMVYAPYLDQDQIGSFPVNSGLPILDLRAGLPHALLAIPVPHFVDPVYADATD
jgi:hypothetical protein